MTPENQQLQELRTLILRSQYESLSEAEIAQLNSLIRTEGGAQEAATLIDQLCAFTDSGALDSLPIAEALSEAFATTAANAIVPLESVFPDKFAHKSSASITKAPVKSGQWTRVSWLLALVASNLLIASFVWFLARNTPTTATRAEFPAEVNSQQPEVSSPQLISVSPQLVSMTACVWRPSGDLVPAIGEPIELVRF